MQFASFTVENTHILTCSKGSVYQVCYGGKFNICVEIQNTLKLNTLDFKLTACPWKCEGSPHISKDMPNASKKMVKRLCLRQLCPDVVKSNYESPIILDSP